MVIDRGAFLSGRYAKVYDEIVQVKEACGEAHLKVILETGELGTYDNVRRASLLAMTAGADFIKTSTGKIQPAATLPVTLCMLEVIRDVHDETGRMVGMKPAGGIRYARSRRSSTLCVVNETLGVDWLTPDLFRFGASSLLNDVLMQIRKQRTGAYQSARLLHDRLMDEVEKRSDARVAPLEWEYAPAPEARDIVAFRDRYGLFVGGEEVEPRSGEWFRTISPATEEPLAEVAQAGAEDVDLAVGAARGAFENGWSTRCARASERSISSASHGSCRSALASWRWPSRSTVASRSRSRATSTCRWPRPTSSTTRAGRTSSSTRSPTGGRDPSASRRRSSRGTSRS